MSLPVVQWLEHPTGVQKVMGSIPVGDSDFFFFPRLRHVDYSIFSYFFSELKIHHLSLFITIRPLRNFCQLLEKLWATLGRRVGVIFIMLELTDVLDVPITYLQTLLLVLCMHVLNMQCIHEMYALHEIDVFPS